MINIIEAYKEGLLNRKHWLANIISGVIVGVVALPLAIAFAIASGVKPEQGLYTAIIAGLIVSVFGGSRLQIAGPTGAFVVVLFAITNKYGIDGLQTATFLAGIILVLFGVTRLGFIMRFIPSPVIVGFTAGIGTVIFVGQWKYFFGLHMPQTQYFHQTCAYLFQEIHNFNLNTTLIAFTSLFIVIYANKLNILKRIPGTLSALVIATGLQAIFNFADVATIGSEFGGITQSLPQFKLPSLNYAMILELMAPAFTIAMLGSIESLLSAVVADGMAGTRHNPNQELIGQGLANMIAPLFGGFAATGAIARTATNIQNGGTSPLAGIIHSLTLILVIVCLAPLAMYIPLACLAAILFRVAFNMSQLNHVQKIIKRAPKYDVLILVVTYFLTVFIDLVVAVNVGVLLAVVNFLFKMSKSTTIMLHDNHKNTSVLQQNLRIPNDVLIYTINGPLFFGVIENFQQTLKAIHYQPKTLIFKLGWVPFIDSSSIDMLENVILDMHSKNTRVILTDLNDLILKKLDKAGIIQLLGDENVHPNLNSALACLKSDKVCHNETILPVKA